MNDSDSLRATLDGPPRRAGFVVAGAVLAATAVVAGFLFRPPREAPRVTPKLTAAPLAAPAPSARDPIPDPEPLPSNPAPAAAAGDTKNVAPARPLAKRAAGSPTIANARLRSAAATQPTARMPASSTSAAAAPTGTTPPPPLPPATADTTASEPELPPLPNFPIPTLDPTEAAAAPAQRP